MWVGIVMTFLSFLSLSLAGVCWLMLQKIRELESKK